jgi:hypothetical protein
MESSESSTVATAALAYCKRGWSVLPVRPRDKRPLLPWEPLQRSPAGEAEIRGWFERWPDANIGIVTGAVSGLVVLDIDPQHDGEESLARLEREHGPLPVTVEALTGGGGRHLYFAHPGGLVRNKAGLAPGIDLRGDGGYVVAPPSMHPSGRRYAWEVSHHPDDMPVAPLPGWLAARLADGAARLGHPRAHWRAIARDGVGEGQRNTTLASFAGHLLWHGVDPEVALELLACWNAQRCRPPLPQEEVARTVESIARLHAREHPGA